MNKNKKLECYIFIGLVIVAIIAVAVTAAVAGRI